MFVRLIRRNIQYIKKNPNKENSKVQVLKRKIIDLHSYLINKTYTNKIK